VNPAKVGKVGKVPRCLGGIIITYIENYLKDALYCPWPLAWVPYADLSHAALGLSLARAWP
jgi:hypothetical protein